MKIVETRDSSYTVQLENQFIHSKYSPIREAEKFLNRTLKSPQTLIVLGAGLGHMFPILEQEHPHIRVISIPYNKECGTLSIDLNPSKREQWSGECEIESYINQIITESTLRHLQIIEWEPVARHYMELSKQINSIIIRRVRVINGNILTAKRFGKRWLNNSIKNFLNIDSYIENFVIDRPIVIIASGKSLEESVSVIKELQNSLFIIALSSATQALKFYEIEPDLVFSTDAGYYAKLHISGDERVLVIPMNSAKSTDTPVLLLNQGNFFEEEFISEADLPNVPISENGTVAGTALEFALRNSSQKIYLCGQDLQSADINSHISPYAFDNLLKKESNRIKPYYSIMYSRFVDQGVSFKTYRDWFSRVGNQFQGRIKRINHSTQPIDGIEDITVTEFQSMITTLNDKSSIKYQIKSTLPLEMRVQIVNKVLQRWLKSLDEGEIRENPLIPLIYRGDHTDDNSKALSTMKREAENYLERMLHRYGRKLL